jgi:RNA polymerase sigma-70 factor (ECF subfamily)
MVRDKDEAKDLVQESFVRLWEKGKGLQPEQIKSWLFTTGYRLSLAHIEKSKKFVSEEFLSDFQTQAIDNPDLKSIIQESLLLLSEAQKSILMLRDYEGFQYKEIADILEISEESVKVQLFRARQKIKNHLKDLKFVL